jgi:hypothetical protein
LAPEELNTISSPAQIVAEEGLIEITGSGLVLIATNCEAEQPSVLVPVTVYTVFPVGVTTTALLVDPLLHEYVFAPLAVIITLEVRQMLVLAGVTVTFGKGRLTRVTKATAVQPRLFAPLTA